MTFECFKCRKVSEKAEVDYDYPQIDWKLRLEDGKDQIIFRIIIGNVKYVMP